MRRHRNAASDVPRFLCTSALFSARGFLEHLRKIKICTGVAVVIACVIIRWTPSVIFSFPVAPGSAELFFVCEMYVCERRHTWRPRLPPL